VSLEKPVYALLGLSEYRIFSVSRDVFTPFHLGLAVQLYHDIGSKQLIETLHSNGFCASYGEVKRYLTSIAHHEIEKNQDGVYVPDGMEWSKHIS
jgi:hypothetical protein